MKKAAVVTVLLIFLLGIVTAYAAGPCAVTVRPSLSFEETPDSCGTFALPIPDEWVNRDAGCEIIIFDSNTCPDFRVPWNSNHEEITAIPIPDIEEWRCES